MADHSFCRAFLKEVMKDVKKAGFKAGDAWVYNFGIGHHKQFEFHGPDGYYNTSVSQHCAYDAKANGWLAYLDTQTRRG